MAHGQHDLARVYQVRHKLTIIQIVDYAIWRLFNREYRGVHRPAHILCHGYQPAGPPKNANKDQGVATGILGLCAVYPNNHVTQIKGTTWNDFLRLMGKDGEMILLNLLLDCGIFIPVDQGRNNFYQLSGDPTPFISS